ncbi:MAG: hypothetical protein A2177_06130 [Spirochaetes bacterium RBG_13_68_11]|nr:MAG: hypothetical protein A2177_06130 [Spirochaetes bacterium RBG_13_68_11]
MQLTAQRFRLSVYAASVCLTVVTLLSCASLSPAEVEQESGFYYGYGSGASAAEAADAARRDLISNALTESARLDGSGTARVEVSAEAVKSFDLPKLKPIAEDTAGDLTTIVYRIKAKEWDKREQGRQSGIRTEVMQKLTALETNAGLPLTDRLVQAGELLDRLGSAGLAALLYETGPGSSLVSSRIESFCRGLSAGLSIQASPKDGFIAAGAEITVKVQTSDGKPAGSVPLVVEWTVRGVEPSSSTAKTGPDGQATLVCPASQPFRNRSVRLTAATDLARSAPRTAGLIGDAAKAEARYFHHDDIDGYFSAEVLVPGGSFTAGALPGDKRATRKEAPRPAETASIFIDVYPVTNALYEMFLDDTGAGTFPEYWDNPDYNQPDQPVVGVSLEDANRFAAWLSVRLGVARRLPTEDEWEKAARGGQDVLYPWGDQSPVDGVRANYSGNGRFNATSPVGSFEAGRNAYGIYDMAGNVWQWTSTPLAAGTGTARRIVKGGSWMDGPNDLRVSNRRDVDPSKGYVDVGFRLVREASND